MHTGDTVAWVKAEDPLKHVVILMTQQPLRGARGVVSDHALEGFITDGDMCRALQAHDHIRGLTAYGIRTRKPVVTLPSARLMEALNLMENRLS